MIRILSLAAALAVLPLSGALADDRPKTPSEASIEAAAEAFEARMEAMSARAKAISEDESLSEDQRAARLDAVQAEYQPEIAAFTATITQQAGQIAAEALAGIDIGAVVEEAMNDPEVQAAMQQGLADGVAAGTGIARNSAWTNPDPEQVRTYGLIAQYALDQAADAVEDADDASEDADNAEAEAAPERAEAPAPHR